MSIALYLESTQAENNMDVDAADVEYISSPIAYHADLVDSAYEPEATLVYDIAEEDATEVGDVEYAMSMIVESYRTHQVKHSII
jgi:hypothetical protein